MSISDRDTSVMLIDCARMATVWPLAAVRRERRKRLESARAKDQRSVGSDRSRLERPRRRVSSGPFASDPFHRVADAALAALPRQFVYQANPVAPVWEALENDADAAGFQPFTAERPSRKFAALSGGDGTARRGVPSGRRQPRSGAGLPELMARAGRSLIWCITPWAIRRRGRRIAAQSAESTPARCRRGERRHLQPSCWNICPTRMCPGCSTRCSQRPASFCFLVIDDQDPGAGDESRRRDPRSGMVAGADRRRRPPASAGSLAAGNPHGTASAGCHGTIRGGRCLANSPGCGFWPTTRRAFDPIPGAGASPGLARPRSSSCVSTCSTTSATGCLVPVCAAWIARLGPADATVAGSGDLGRQAQRAGGALDRRAECRRHPSGPPGTQRRRSGGALRSGTVAAPTSASSPIPVGCRRLAPLNPFDRAAIESAAERWQDLFGDAPRPRIALIVGGDSALHRCDPSAAATMGEEVRAFAGALGGFGVCHHQPAHKHRGGRCAGASAGTQNDAPPLGARRDAKIPTRAIWRWPTSWS